MKFLFDLFPVLLFFAAYAITGDIFTATATTIAATIFQVAYSWFRHRKVDTMLWISFGLVSLLGGATLYFRNQDFMYWKPTALNWLLAILLLGSLWLKKINLIEKMMGPQITLPPPVWRRLLFAWVLFFVAMGFLNLYVVHLVHTKQLEEGTWVKLKVFGTLALTLVFGVLQSLYLSRFVEQDKGNGPQA